MTSSAAGSPDHEADIRSADQRATALTATATITASLALTGATIVVDTSKLVQPGWIRVAFGIALLVTLAAFTAGAIVAARGHRSQWESGAVNCSCSDPAKLRRDKHRAVTVSMASLVAGMVGLICLAVLALIAR